MMKKILIVDDEPNILLSLEYTFKKKNYSVYIARDGSEAIEIMKNEFPDLVLLDIMMPNVDGFETLDFIKKNATLAHTKVVFISAKSKEKDIQKGIDAGANDYVTKPFSIKNLVEKVEVLLS